MKLLWLTQNYPPSWGGMAQSCDRIVRNLRKKGVFIHIVHFYNKQRFFSTKPIENGLLTTIPLKQTEDHTLNLAEIYLTENFDFSDYDYLVAFGGFLPVLALPVFSKLFSLKTALLFRGNDFDVALYSPKRRNILFQAIEIADKIAVNSSAKKFKIQKIFNKKVDFIPNGIDTELWKPFVFDVNKIPSLITNLRIDTNKIVLGFFGFLKKKKGLDFFLNTLIFEGLLDKFHLLIVGDAEDDVLEILQHPQMNFSFVNFTNHFDLIPYYLISDFVVIPSYYEGMPNVLLEAMALGSIPITSDADGLKDLMSEILPDFMFKRLDFVSLKNLLYKILELSDKQKKMLQSKIKKFVLENYSAEKEAENYLKFFNT